MTYLDMTKPIIGRIEFERRWVAMEPQLRSPGYTVEKPIKTFDEFFARARALHPPVFHWLIEVCFDGDSRAPRYFTGECEAGWVGCTTIRADLAQKYSSKELAENDIAKLAPRLIGKWVAREHGFS